MSDCSTAAPDHYGLDMVLIWLCRSPGCQMVSALGIFLQLRAWDPLFGTVGAVLHPE